MEIKSALRWLWNHRNGNLLFFFVIIAVTVKNFVMAQDGSSIEVSGPGEAVPYPTYHEVPRNLPFTCSDKQPGYYADPDTRCQVWHWCVPSGHKYSFLCPNGTVFNQAFRVCDWFYNVDCQQAISHYNVNDDLYKDSEGNLIKG